MTVNLHDQVFSICEALGVDPHHTARIIINPASATVETYATNEACHVRYDAEADAAAMNPPLVVKIRT